MCEVFTLLSTPTQQHKMLCHNDVIELSGVLLRMRRMIYLLSFRTVDKALNIEQMIAIIIIIVAGGFLQI